MNKRTEKTPCKPESVLGKIPFSTKSKSNRFQAKNKPQEYNKKKKRAITAFVNLKCFSMNSEIFNVKSVVQKLHQKQFNAILSYLNRKPVFNATLAQMIPKSEASFISRF
jgi:hypothetical protein